MQTWYRVAAGAIGWFVIGLHYYLIASRPDVGLAEAGGSRQGRSPGGCFILWVTPPFPCSTAR